MRLKSALVAGTLAWKASSAFLIPLDISESIEEAKIHPALLEIGSPYRVELDCPNCPLFASEGQSSSWVNDEENKLLFDFSIDHDESLRINDRIVFSRTNQQSFPGPLSASQLRTADSFTTEPIRLGWALEIFPTVMDTSEMKSELYTLQLTILDLKGVPVEVDSLKINLLKYTGLDSATHLKLVKISPVPFSSTPGASSCHNASQWSLCRLRAIIAARIHAMLEAAKAHVGAAKSWAKGGCKGKKGPFGGHRGPFGGHRPHGKGEGRPHHGPHGHHGPQHHGHRFGHIFRQTLRFFIVPALLGVIGGLMASAIGMIVGQFIVYLWTRFHRGGQRGSIRIIEEVAVEDDEKDVLIVESEDLPPCYTDDEPAVVVVEEEEKK